MNCSGRLITRSVRGNFLQLGKGFARAAPELPVILQAEVQNLGPAGKQVTVPQGYAHNWLIPKKLAIYDLHANFGGRKPKSKQVETKDVGSDSEIRPVSSEQRELQQMVQRLLSQPIVVKRKFRRGEILEGQVTRGTVIDAIAKQTKIQLHPELLEMHGPILRHGTYDIPLGIIMPDQKPAVLEVNVRLP